VKAPAEPDPGANRRPLPGVTAHGNLARLLTDRARLPVAPGPADVRKLDLEVPTIRRIPIVMALIALLLGLGGCGGEVARESVTLADFDFSLPREIADPDSLFDWPAHVHWFERGWEKDTADGLWSLGEEAVLQIYLLGTDCRLSFRCCAPPLLAENGQRLTVLVNDTMLDTVPLPKGWEEKNCEVALPAEIVRPGMNTVTFRFARQINDGEETRSADDRPLAVFFKRLVVTAQLDEKQQQAFREILAPEEGDPDGEWIPLPVRHAEKAGASGGGDSGADMRPDLLLILLDAARADHLGCYGYERPTTPVIDRLATEGLRFPTVFSPASYTRAAVPSLITGLSWVDHRVIYFQYEGRSDALADTFLTLAEILEDAGYQTLAISNNGNFSLATNTDQGFAEFVGAWKQDGHTWEDIEFPERIFHRRLAQGFGPEPVYFHLHLLPPCFPSDSVRHGQALT